MIRYNETLDNSHHALYTDMKGGDKVRYLSIKKVAEELGVSYRTIYTGVRTGTIPAIRVMGQWRIPESFIDKGTGDNASMGKKKEAEE